MAYNFKCLVEIEGRLKVTGSHVHCKCSNVSETVQECCYYRALMGSDLFSNGIFRTIMQQLTIF